MNIQLEQSGLNRRDKITRIANLSPFFAEENDTIKEVVQKMISGQHRRIPIVNKKKDLIGVVTTMDILDAFLRHQNFNEPIKSIMIRDIVFCMKDDSLGFVLQKLKLSRRGGMPIVSSKKELVGIISERDFVKPFIKINFNTTVEEVMTKKPLIVHDTISIFDCLKSMINSHYRRLPVVKEKQLVGIVTSADMIKYIFEHDYKFDDLNVPIDFIVRKDVLTISNSKDISEAIKLMRDKDVGGILVTDEKNNLEGIITERDIIEEIV